MASELSAYELQRRSNIERNNFVLQTLGLIDNTVGSSPAQHQRKRSVEQRPPPGTAEPAVRRTRVSTSPAIMPQSSSHSSGNSDAGGQGAGHNRWTSIKQTALDLDTPLRLEEREHLEVDADWLDDFACFLSDESNSVRAAIVKRVR